MNKRVQIVTPNSLIIPDTIKLRREYTRPKQFINDDYIKNYDDNTIFFDVFYSGKRIYLLGPPLLNLEPLLESCIAYDDKGISIPFKLTTKRLERHQLTWIDSDYNIKNLTFDLSKIMPGDEKNNILSIAPSEDLSYYFIDRKCLMTLSKNNKLNWIYDWIEYYQSNHKIDTVFIYDNGSEEYSLEDMAEYLESTSTVKNIVIIDWKFKYGPQGAPWTGPNTPWDSDFCQIGALQDVRLKFALYSKGFINADIDELIVPLDNIDIFEALESSLNGVIGVEGVGIEGIPSNNSKFFDNSNVSFYDFWYKKRQCGIGGRKWAGCPKKWLEDVHLTAHWVRNIDYKADPRFSLGHYRRINNGWKVTSRLSVSEKNDNIRTDFALLASLAKSFPNEIPKTTLIEALYQAEKEYIYLENLNNSITKRDLLQSFITLRTEYLISWIKKWVWKDNVLVFEVKTELGIIAYDVFETSEEIIMNVSVRDSSYFEKFYTRLLEYYKISLPILKNGKGVTITKLVKQSKTLENLSRDLASSMIEIYEMFKHK